MLRINKAYNQIKGGNSVTNRGLGRKKWLLQLESRNSGKDIQEEIAF